MDKLVSESSAANSDSRFSSRSHSIRLCGSVTSIRLENAFWDVLALMAAEKSVSLNQLIAKIHAEMSGLNRPTIPRRYCAQYALSGRGAVSSRETGVVLSFASTLPTPGGITSGGCDLQFHKCIQGRKDAAAGLRGVRYFRQCGGLNMNDNSRRPPQSPHLAASFHSS